MDTFNLRHFDGSLEKFIEKERPDVVVVLYNEGVLEGPDVELGGVFDFR